MRRRLIWTWKGAPVTGVLHVSTPVRQVLSFMTQYILNWPPNRGMMGSAGVGPVLPTRSSLPLCFAASAVPILFPKHTTPRSLRWRDGGKDDDRGHYRCRRRLRAGWDWHLLGVAGTLPRHGRGLSGGWSRSTVPGEQRLLCFAFQAVLNIRLMPKRSTEETLRSLYVINKQARKYAEKAHEHYQNERHAAAARNSARKEALYDLKGRVLSEIAGEASRVERHQIDGKVYLCLYIREFSFHAHLDEVSVDADQIEGETETLDNFEKTAQKQMDRTLKDSLLHLQEKFGISANDLLPKKNASYAHRESYNGWKYLKQGLMDKPVWKQRREEVWRQAHEAREEEQESRPPDIEPHPPDIPPRT